MRSKLTPILMALIVILTGSLTFTAAARQGHSLTLQQENHQSLVILRCATGVSVLVPASQPDRRQRAYQKCLRLAHVSPIDPLVARAVRLTP